MRVCIDMNRCIHAGECYFNHPRLFASDEDGAPRVVIKRITTDREQLEAAQAIEVCPSAAISIEEDE